MPPTTRHILRCRDPKTYRTIRRTISAAVIDVGDPVVIANLLIALNTGIGRSWPANYAVPFPIERLEWDVYTEAVSTVPFPISDVEVTR